MCKLTADKITVGRTFRPAPYESINFQLECAIERQDGEQLNAKDITAAFNRVLSTIERSYAEIQNKQEFTKYQ